MKISNKIYSDIKELKAHIDGTIKKNKKIILCQGHFNVIHIGHLRFLEFAKKQGDVLIVLVQGYDKLEPRVRDKFFDESERARSVASLEFVDLVFIFNTISFKEVIELIRPKVYVRGEEFAKQIDKIKDEIDLIESYGGKVVFSSGEAHFAQIEFLEKDPYYIKQERLNLLREALKRQDISIKKIIDYCNSFHGKHILVIGDTIVDQYVACDALGMSSEAPVMVIREIESKEFIGGAAIVSRHIKALGAKCSFITLLGKDTPADSVREELKKEEINAHYIIDEDRPTTYKIRYIVDTQKLLRVSRLKEHHLNQKMEQEVIHYLNDIGEDIDGIVISDFGYGMITPTLLEEISKFAEKNNIKLFGDVQSSSQIGDVTKFKNYFLLTPTEKEARIALNDKYSGLEYIGNSILQKTNALNIILKLGFIFLTKRI
jgi:rfaE bifunctional protein kinase chain/domain